MKQSFGAAGVPARLQCANNEWVNRRARRPALRMFVLGLLVFMCATSAFAQKFGHGRRSHRPIPCSSCHSVTIARPNVTRFPGHKACISCHNFAEMATREFRGFCGVCHAGTPQSATRPALFSFPKRSLASEFGVSFSHAAHMRAVLKSADRSLNCKDCHSVVEPAGGRTVETRQVSGGRVAPEVILAEAHENCFRCHGMSPEKPPAMNQCAGCHQLGGSKSPQIQGTVPRFHHADHIYDIRPKRKADYAKKVDLCVECHSNVAVTASLKEIRVPESTFCTQCHNGRFGLPEPLSSEVLNKLAAFTLLHKETLLARNGR